MSYVEFQNVRKIYRSGEVEIAALKGASFSVERGEFAVIVGASGAGKTTILNILGGMDRLTDGQVLVDGRDISACGKKELTDYRRFDVGFVFQFYNLLQNLTALENVEMASEISADMMKVGKKRKGEAPRSAADILQEVGLGERMQNFPSQLSGGEQQRVAIARALAKNPKLLLCDEPTGALDDVTGKTVLSILSDTCRKKGKTVIVITHNQAISQMADRIITVKSGVVASEVINPNPKDVTEIDW